MEEGDKSKGIKKPWPTKDAMAQIYAEKLWGGNSTDFYSGIGSHHEQFVQPYVDAVSRFLISHQSELTVCDLGCGDFNVGRQLLDYTKRYVAVDIVEELIERNKGLFQSSKLEFQCLDIAIDELPSGDCAIVRQVLQHLSNAEVLSITQKLKDYKYVIVTEHIPLGDFEPNKDIISGQGIRFKKQSGVNLLEPPFQLQIKHMRRLTSTILDDGKGVVETLLYQIR